MLGESVWLVERGWDGSLGLLREFEGRGGRGVAAEAFYLNVQDVA